MSCRTDKKTRKFSWGRGNLSRPGLWWQRLMTPRPDPPGPALGLHREEPQVGPGDGARHVPPTRRPAQAPRVTPKPCGVRGSRVGAIHDFSRNWRSVIGRQHLVLPGLDGNPRRAGPGRKAHTRWPWLSQWEQRGHLLLPQGAYSVSLTHFYLFEVH